MDIRIFSCLFVKFVLYTAGFLGEGTLLILYRFYQGFSFFYFDRTRNISGHPELNHSALLNFCRELLIYDKCTENKDYVKNIVEKIPLNQNNKELSNLREQIILILFRIFHFICYKFL